MELVGRDDVKEPIVESGNRIHRVGKIPFRVCKILQIRKGHGCQVETYTVVNVRVYVRRSLAAKG
eukprot:4741416-Pleurochrysis_carterae.AAC.1